MDYDYVEGRFEERPNRFIAKVRVEGVLETVHVPNTGRLKELLPSQARVLLSFHGEAGRKTKYSMRFIERKGLWVSMDSQLPNQVVKEALKNRRLEMFEDFESFRTEAAYGNSRFDFMLKGERATYVEVKGVTLEKGGWGYFPDAPTERGRKHLKELMAAVEAGHGGAVVFLNQNPHAQGFSPHDETDPEFGMLLREAAGKGVLVIACTCRVSPEEIVLDRTIPVAL